MAPKRRLPPSAHYSDATGAKANKRSAESTPRKNHPTNGAANEPFPASSTKSESRVAQGLPIAENAGIIQREFYPPEMSNERCAMYNNNEIPRPIEVLETAIRSTKANRESIGVGDGVLHWFKRDLRLYDNRALSAAFAKAKGAGKPLVCLFVVSPQDYQAHLTSPARVDFDLRCLSVLKRDLAELDIPLLVATKDKRQDIPRYLVDVCKEYGIKHVFCNIEYEVDELRRESRLINMCLDNGIDFTPLHDDVIVPPGTLKSGAGNQYAVYTPWFRAWIKHVHEHPHLLDPPAKPGKNPPWARKKFMKIFESEVPPAPKNKQLSDTERLRFENLWPAGEHEALLRLQKFLAEKVGRYKDTRNLPGANSTAVISVHHSAGTLAARTSVRSAKEANGIGKLDGGNPGIAGWISEIAWRDFYKHVLAHWPYICMSKPFKFEYSNIEWEYNDAHFAAWCSGRTGYPIVDAAMRQLNETAYMHNRCRMVVASFLAKDLLLDWRLGERYFMEHLVDGDFASNNGGWGFSASTGVDPQPYFRIFNPVLQSEKFDADGDYIRKWVPELRSIKGKAIHDPYARGEGKQAESNGYPRPIVDHKMARDRALTRYKAGIGRATT